MPHRNTLYNNPDQKVNEANAIKDLKEWLTTRNFNKVSKEVKASIPPITRQWFRNMCSMMAGVEGYPVEVWMNQMGLAKDDPEEPAEITKGQ